MFAYGCWDYNSIISQIGLPGYLLVGAALQVWHAIMVGICKVDDLARLRLKMQNLLYEACYIPSQLSLLSGCLMAAAPKISNQLSLNSRLQCATAALFASAAANASQAYLQHVRSLSPDLAGSCQ